MPETVTGFSPSPGLKTAGELKAEVGRFCGTPDNPRALAVAQDGIEHALRRINSKMWRWSVAVYDITLDDTQSDPNVYDGPADFHKTLECMFLDADNKPAYELHWIEPEDFQRLEIYNGPVIWSYTIYNYRNDGKVTITGTIDANFVSSNPKLRLRYYRFIPYPTKDTQVLEVPSNVEDFVAWQAKAYAASVLKPAVYALAANEALRSWKLLLVDSREEGDL